MAQIEIAAPAKINLRLVVLAQETSGYHQIETVFCRLALADTIVVESSGTDVTLAVEFPHAEPVADLGPADRNLAVRAAHAFFAASGCTPGAAIRLHKRIPAGAGLGGGSSNAAAVLRALNELHGEPLSEERLLSVGAELGSDVPFFIAGAPLALAWGRGGRLLPLPRLPQRTVLLVLPGVHVATADAYRWLAEERAATRTATPTEPPPAAVLRVPTDWRDIAAVACNDFETVIFERVPRLAELRSALQSHGAAIARMTGSGSVLFGVFTHEAEAVAAAARLHEQFTGVQCVLTSTAGGAVPGGGFEPPLADPKSAVLPLNDPGSESEN